MDYGKHLSVRETPQSEPIPGKAMVPNSAGGYGFAVDDWMRLDRFLILGADGPTYYTSERQLTQDNAACVGRCLAADGARTVARIADLSVSGRAPKNDPALFALALAVALGDPATKAAALAALPRVCRIGTHLFHFVRALEQVTPKGSKAGKGPGTYGRSVRRALGRWYTVKPVDAVAYQAIKYGQRDGWSHRDVLRLAHPKPGTHGALFRWIVGKTQGMDRAEFPALVGAVDELAADPTVTTACRLIREHDLPREAIPSPLLASADVWAALAERMPVTAMIRNLATLTRVGVCAPLSAGTKHVIDQLADTERLAKARVHPIQVLAALRTYAQGHGERGKATWTPVQAIVDALDRAFYAAFASLTPSSKRHVLALDVSGSMGVGTIAGVAGLTPREAACAMALVCVHQYPQNVIVGFTAGSGRAQTWSTHHQDDAVSPLAITTSWRLDKAVEYVARLPFGGTDCSLPMLWARKQKVPAEAFTIVTDNETWAGRVHPVQALGQYRDALGIPAKCAVIGMTATGFSIADPQDGGMLDVVGFDTAVPTLLADFIG